MAIPTSTDVSVQLKSDLPAGADAVVRGFVVLAFDGMEAMEDADLFIAALPDHEFTIPGFVLAREARITSAPQRASCRG